MKVSQAFRILVIVLLVFYLYGCSTMPTAMIERTKQSREDAVAEHADQFALDLWSAGEKAWQDANVKIDAKSYGEAEKLLLRAKTNFDKAHSLAKGRRENAIKEITDLQGTVNIRLKTDLTENPAVKNLSTARKKQFDAAVSQIQENIAKVAAQLQNAQYADAKLTVGKTLRDIYEVQQEYLKK